MYGWSRRREICPGVYRFAKNTISRLPRINSRRPAATRKPFAVEEPDPYAKDADAKKDYDAFLKLDAVQFLLAEKEQPKQSSFRRTMRWGTNEATSLP